MKNPITIPLVLSLLSATRAWCDYRIPFGIPAPATDSVRRTYGAYPWANPASKVELSVKDSVLTLDATKIASDEKMLAGYDGYTANVGVSIPIKPDRNYYNLKGLQAISFEFRNSDPIPDQLRISLYSKTYPCGAIEGEILYQADALLGQGNLPAGTEWKKVELSLLDFAFPPVLSGADSTMPPLDSVLKYLSDIEISPRTTYTDDGIQRGGRACTKCVNPTMTRQTLEIRNLVLIGVSTPLKMTATWSNRPYEYSGTFQDSSELREQFGISSFSNTASTTKVGLENGTVVLQATLRSDSGVAGRVGYSVEVGVDLPYRTDNALIDLTGLDEIEFEFRNSDKITDYLAVQIGSPILPDSLVRQGKVYNAPITGATSLAAGTTWKKANVNIMDFLTPSWWADIPDDYPSVEEVLKQFRSLRFIPMTKYSDSGFQNGVSCYKCVGPTMGSQKLEIRNISLIGPHSYPRPNICPETWYTSVHRTTSKARFAASYRNGFLQVQRLPGYNSIDVVSASGSRIARFDHDRAVMPLALERGTYFAVARGAGLEPLVKRFVVVR